MNREVGMTIGVMCGVIFGLIIAAILMKFSNKDKKIKTVYDERQEAIRGRAYRYAFYTLVALEVVMTCVAMAEVELPVDVYLIHVFNILVSCFVLCTYCIWNGCYWGLNNNKKSFAIVMVVALLINALPVVNAIRMNELMLKGEGSLPCLNVMVLVWAGLLGIVGLVKKLASHEEAEEDEA